MYTRYIQVQLFKIHNSIHFYGPNFIPVVPEITSLSDIGSHTTKGHFSRTFCNKDVAWEKDTYTHVCETEWVLHQGEWGPEEAGVWRGWAGWGRACARRRAVSSQYHSIQDHKHMCWYWNISERILCCKKLFLTGNWKLIILLTPFVLHSSIFPPWGGIFWGHFVYLTMS